MKRLKWPGLALLLGVLGAALRRWQLNTAFEGELKLCAPFAPASLALIAFAVLAAAAMALLCARTDVHTPAEDGSGLTPWDTAFAAKGDTVYLLLMVLAGFATLAAVPSLLRDSMEMLAARRASGEGELPFLQLVLLCCAVPGGLGHILTARAAARMEGRGRERGALMFPGLLGCVWLLEAYRANAADPVLWDYVPLLFAAAAGMLFFLSCGSMALDLARPRRMLWLAGMTVAMSGAALGGAPALPDLLLLAGQTLAALAALWLVPGNLERMPDPAGFGTGDDGPDTGETQHPEPAGGSSGQDNELEDTTNGQE